MTGYANAPAEMRDELRSQNLSFTEIAKVVGERWQVIPPVEKDPFEKKASAAKEQYNTELARYKKTDNYEKYSKYLAEFKAKNAPPLAGTTFSAPRLSFW